MPHTFVVSDESINEYGFRVLTNGIDLTQFRQNPIMLYMHNRNTYNPTGGEVIGRWENIRVEGDKLLADAVFDESETLGKKIADKVRGGFIKMASIGIRKREISEAKEHLKAGQTRPTVTKSVLDEISIVDMGGNNNALKLYNNNGEEEQLQELNFKSKPNMSELKSVAIALGLDAEASEAEVLVAVSSLKSAKETAETKLGNFEDALKLSQKKEQDALLAKAEKLGLIDKAAVPAYEALFAKDHDNTKNAVEALLATKKDDDGKQAQLGNFLKGIGGNATNEPTDAKLTFDYLQRYNSVQLKHIKENEPETYAQLVADYAKGVRYTKPSNN